MGVGDTHWVTGTFELGKPTPGAYFGPEGQDGKFHVTGQGIPEPPAAGTPADRGGPDARRWGSSEPGHSGTPKSHIIYTPVPSLARVQTLLSAYRA